MLDAAFRDIVLGDGDFIELIDDVLPLLRCDFVETSELQRKLLDLVLVEMANHVARGLWPEDHEHYRGFLPVVQFLMVLSHLRMPSSRSQLLISIATTSGRSWLIFLICSSGT